MSPYNAYSSTLSSSYTPSTSKYTSTSYAASPPLSCRYKPPAYSSTLSSRYNSRTKFESPSTYTPSTYSSSTYTPSSISRQLSSTYISNRVPKFTSVSSYTNAITSSSSDWKWRSSTASSDIASEKLLRSPSLSSSRRNSSTSSVATLPRIQDRSSLSSYTSGIDEPSRSSIGYKSSAGNEDRTLSNLGHTSSSGRLSLLSYKPLSEIEDRTGVSPGLYNLGNTCFMNSILQCLVYTEPLVDYFTNRDYVKDLKSPSNGNLTSAFHDFTSTMKNSDTSSSVRPYKLRSQVQKYAPRFSGDNQQDAQEFLRCLLQGLHDEVNRVKSRTTRRASSINSDSFWSWRLYKDSDDSLITDLFAGQLQSTLKCTMCSHESITYDPFWDLSLPMPENRSNVSLRDCYSMFTSPEFLDGPDRPMCDRCQKKTRSSKQIEISIFPKILVIHLKRFSASRSGNHKIGMMVDCPLTLSSASDLASHNSFSDRCSYSLYGVVDHIGGKNAGHYVAKCRSPSMREWHEYSDARVTKATSIITCNSYILFYTQRNSG